jgi:PAS domain-containing protein
MTRSEEDLGHDRRLESWRRTHIRLSVDEVIGRSIAVLIPPDRPDELAGIMRRISEGVRVGPDDTVRLTKYGGRVHVTLTVSPIRDEAHQIVGAVAVARDITAQQRADLALLRGEARWRAIIESAVDGIVVIDRRGRIESFNHAAEQLFGYRADEVLGHSVSMLMPQPCSQEHDHYLKRYLDAPGANHQGSAAK